MSEHPYCTRRKKRVGIGLLSDISQLLLAAAASWSFILHIDPALSFSSPLSLHVLNFLPVFLLVMLLWSLSEKLVFSLLVTLVFGAALFHVHEIKLAELDEPVVATDFLLLKQLLSNPGLFTKYLTWPPLIWTAVILGSVILFLLLCFERPFTKHSRPTRVTGFIIAATALLSLLGAAFSSNQLYQDAIINWKPWVPKENAKQHGLVFSLFKDAAAITAGVEKGDSNVVQAWVARNREVLSLLRTLPEELPDIVIIMNEAFFDPGILKGVDECVEIPAFCQLAAQGVSGYLTSPSYGGQTLRVEFEFLTGLGMAQFPGHTLPYFSLVTRPVSSVAWDLARLGYQTTAVHPFKRTFWNRHVAFRFLGFERFITQEQFDNPRHSGHYIADSEVNKKIIEILCEDQPQLIFAITVENHGPWRNRRKIDQNRVAQMTVPEGLPLELHLQWQQYIYHLHNADRALARIAEFVRGRNRHTVLLFFGDHLPALSPVFRFVGFDSPKAGRHQPTKYLILNNRDPTPVRQDTDAQFLAAQLLYRAGVVPNEFFASSYLLGSRPFHTEVSSTTTEEHSRVVKHLELLRFSQIPKVEIAAEGWDRPLTP